MICKNFFIISIVVCVAWGLESKADNTDCLQLSDSRCLGCGSYVDCSQGTSVVVECSAGTACNENPLSGLPAYCATTSDDGCFCGEEPDGLYSDPFNINKYVQCTGGVASFMECPEGEAFITAEGACTYIEECSDIGTIEVPLSCRTKLTCDFLYGDYEGSFEECVGSDEIFSEDDFSDFCEDPAATVCKDQQGGPIADRDVCRIWHMCDGLGDTAASTHCCAPGTVFDEDTKICVTGSCPPSSYCFEEYWYHKACASQYCPNEGHTFATDTLCSKYYYECKIIGGAMTPVLQVCVNPAQFYNEETGLCEITC